MVVWLGAPVGQKPKLGWATIKSDGTQTEFKPLFGKRPDWFSQTTIYDYDFTSQAPGHNPEKFSMHETGYHAGWRLLSFEEILIAKDKRLPDDHDIEHLYDNAWIRATGVYTTTLAFRTKRPHNYWLDLLRKQEPPQQKVMRRIPCGREHFPPGTVIRSSESKQHEWYAVLGTEAGCLWIGGSAKLWSFDSSRLMSYQRSLDRGRTWLPCYIETECDAD